MTSEIITANSIQAVDSLVANEFEVEIDGQPVTGIFSVKDLVSFKLDVKTTTAIKKMKSPFKITKMVQRDPQHVFNQWIRDTFAAGDDIVRPTRTITILAVDNHVPTRRWTVNKAWISEIRYTDFDSSSSQMIEETLTIEYEDIEESWPLLGDQEQLPESAGG